MLEPAAFKAANCTAFDDSGDMWTAEEDKRIREAVLHHGLKNPTPNP